MTSQDGVCGVAARLRGAMSASANLSEKSRHFTADGNAPSNSSERSTGTQPAATARYLRRTSTHALGRVLLRQSQVRRVFGFARRRAQAGGRRRVARRHQAEGGARHLLKVAGRGESNLRHLIGRALRARGADRCCGAAGGAKRQVAGSSAGRALFRLHRAAVEGCAASTT